LLICYNHANPTGKVKVYAKCLHGRDGVARAAMGNSYL
jgi:hypothetical protein